MLEAARLICSCYALGELAALPQPIAGGLIHRLYRLTTSQGEFAVKVFDPTIMRQQGIRDGFRRAEQLAAALAARGIPAVLALEAPGGTVQDIAGITVIVYPWCDGSVLPNSAATPHQASQIGAILGRIHTLNLPTLNLLEKPPDLALSRKPLPQAEWEALVDQGREQKAEWASALKAALPDLFLWDRAGREAEELLPRTQVISHCDLDQKNVLWEGGAPVLIDWESAGLTRPPAELIGAALDWSGQSAGPPDQGAFAAVIAGYRQEAEFPAALALPLMHSRLAVWSDWLGANMRRSLGSAPASAKQALGIRETIDTLATMYRLAAGMEIWASWCG